MSENTKIEWCDHSWSPWRGCTKVSAGCANCYAEKLSKRNPAVLGQWGKGKPRVLAKNWAKPEWWNRNPFVADHKWVPGLPANLRKTHRATVFPSLCDWLDDEVPIEWLARFLKLIHDTPNLTWLLLTKRPENWATRLRAAFDGADFGSAECRYMVRDWMDGKPPENVWIGTSVEDQPNADRRIPALMKIPAAGRFLSLEPLLGPVNLFDCGAIRISADDPTGRCRDIEWAIIGGESGHGARPCNVEWIRSLVKQGQAAGVATFVKQLGARPLVVPWRQHHFNWRHETSNHDRPDDKLFVEDGSHWRVLLKHPKGGDPAEWPKHYRVREFPEGLR